MNGNVATTLAAICVLPLIMALKQPRESDSPKTRRRSIYWAYAGGLSFFVILGLVLMAQPAW